MPIKSVRYRCAVIILFLLVTPLCQASQGESQQSASYWNLTLGAGQLVMPDYTGADSYRNRTVPWIDVQFGERVQLNFIGGLRYSAIQQGAWEAGPMLSYQSGRTNRSAIKAFEDVSGGAVTGAFVNYRFGPLQLRADAGNAVTGDVSGSRVNLALTFNGRVGQQWLYGVGPGLTWQSRNWNRSVFGVSARDAQASGLSAYDPGSGISDVSLSARVTYLISPNWNATTFARGSRISNAAADSPIVRDVGRRSQGKLGLVLAYRF